MGKQKSKVEQELERYKAELDRADTAVLNASTVRRAREVNDAADRVRLMEVNKLVVDLLNEQGELQRRIAAYPKEVAELRKVEAERIDKLRKLRTSPQMAKFQALQRAFDALKKELLSSDLQAVRNLASADMTFEEMKALIAEAESK